MAICYYYHYHYCFIIIILMLYFLLTFSGTKLTAVELWILLVPVYPLIKLGTFLPLTSVTCQDLAHVQGSSQLQTASAVHWTFSINLPSLTRIPFPLLNPSEFMVPVTSLACYLYCLIIYYLILV
jgi:hypothetical protein